MKCPNCQTEVQQDLFCENCGARLPVNYSPEQTVAKKKPGKQIILPVCILAFAVVAAVVIILMFSYGVFTVSEPTNNSGVYQKGFSNEVEWILYNDGELSLEGNGDMNDETPGWSEYCDSVKNVTIGKDVESVCRGAFTSCKKLDSFTVSKKNKYLSNDKSGVLFNKNKTELIQYPAGSELEEYDIPSGVENIKELSFSNAANLKKVTIPDTVKKIGEKAFSGCKNLEEPEIPDSVTDIADNAFGSEKDAFYKYIKDNLPILDTSNFPDDIEVHGVFSALVEDLDGDGALEMVTFSLTFQPEDDEQRMVELELFVTENGEVVSKGKSEQIYANFGGNGSRMICAFYNNNEIKLNTSMESWGGSSCGTEYYSFTVQNNSLYMGEHYSCYEFYRDHSYKYKEAVSQKEFSSYDEFYAAVAQAGFDTEHYHEIRTKEELENSDKSEFRGNHIFTYLNGSGSYCYGYIFDNTSFNEYLE